GERERGRLEGEARQRENQQQPEVEDGEAEGEPEAGQHPRPPRRTPRREGKRRHRQAPGWLIWSKIPPSSKCVRWASCQPPNTSSMVTRSRSGKRARSSGAACCG